MNYEARLSPASLALLRTIAGLGAVAFGAGLIAAPDRAWTALLMAGFLVTCFALAGLVFVAMQYGVGAGWSISFRRVPEAMVAVLPFGAAAVLLALIFHPYAWASMHFTGFKAVWLNRPFFLARAIVYIIVWLAFGRAIVNTSRRQDADRDVRHTRRNVRLSISFLVAFAITFCLASFDWVMSLDPHWASTIFGVYNFAGMFSGGLAAMILLVLWLRRSGPLHDFVNAEHLHDLGKLLFAFSTFWMYIWFSQYMLIWYANISEETAYYVARTRGAWAPLFLLNMVLNWAAPFAALLPRATKRSPKALGRVAVIVLAGRILDVAIMMMPSQVGVWEVGVLAGAAAAFVLSFYGAIRRAAPVPMGDPYLEESLHYHNA